MAVSNNPNFVSTTDDIIRDTFSILNVYGVDESISAADYQYARRSLNRMIETWTALGYHLWLKQTCFLFPQKNQISYSFSVSSSDHATLNYYRTALSSDAATGSTFIVVDDASNIAVDDYIGVILDTNYIFWTTVDSIAVNQINFPAGVTLPSDAATGKKVFNYTTRLNNPFNVYSGVRHDWSRDIPLNYLSYQEYFELPNKDTATSTPVSYNYDRQRDETIIKVWPKPDTADLLFKFTISRRVFIFDVNSDEPDFPIEWHEAIIYNLAVRLAPSFGKNKDVGFQALVGQATAILQDALAMDNESGSSIYFSPDYRNGKS